jgi:hypothetical protein
VEAGCVTSRDKGKRAELEVVHAFTDAGFVCRRRWEDSRAKGGQLEGDLEIGGLKHNLYAEVRRREKLSLPSWIREVEEKAPGGWHRAVIFRRNREDWHVATPLDQYIALLGDEEL